MDDAILPVHLSGRRLTIVFSQLQHAIAAGPVRQAAHALSIKQSTRSFCPARQALRLALSSLSGQAVAFERRQVVTFCA